MRLVAFLWHCVWLFIILVMREQTLIPGFATRFCCVVLTLGWMRIFTWLDAEGTRFIVPALRDPLRLNAHSPIHPELYCEWSQRRQFLRHAPNPLEHGRAALTNSLRMFTPQFMLLLIAGNRYFLMNLHVEQFHYGFEL